MYVVKSLYHSHNNVYRVHFKKGIRSFDILLLAILISSLNQYGQPEKIKSVIFVCYLFIFVNKDVYISADIFCYFYIVPCYNYRRAHVHCVTCLPEMAKFKLLDVVTLSKFYIKKYRFQCVIDFELVELPKDLLTI